jgi:hypothetical protein
VRILASRDVNATIGSGALHIVDPSGVLGLHLDVNEVQTIGTSLLINNDNVEATVINGGTLRVLTTGRVGINDSSPDFTLDVNGDINASGAVRSNGVALISDARYKTNIATLDNALSAILRLRGVTYDWNRSAFPQRRFPAGRQIGFIAQEVEAILPELVLTDAQGYRAVAYQNVVPVLVEAFKALKQQKDAEIRTLQKENDARQKQIEALNARLERLEAALSAGH